MGRPSTGKAKTAAERMAAFRARKATEAEQLNVFIPPSAMDAVRRLARHRGLTHGDVVSHAVHQLEVDELAAMTPHERKLYRADD